MGKVALSNKPLVRGKTDLEIHTKDYIHIKKLPAKRFITWFIVVLFLLGIDNMVASSNRAIELTSWFIAVMQFLAIMVVALAYCCLYYDTDGNYRG